jgi:hypothetical protein
MICESFLRRIGTKSRGRKAKTENFEAIPKNKKKEHKAG